MLFKKLAPWLIVFEVLRVGRDHWQELDPADRGRATDIMKRSKGDPRRLTPADKRELVELGKRFELGRLAVSMGTAAVMGRRRRRRRRP
ncbi:MAG: hypothetical protein ACXVFK_16495 [Solirubrobacteraceae bacterium]